VLENVLARAAPLEELYARHDNGRTLIRTRYADFEPGCRAYGVHRGVLFHALYKLVCSQPVDVRPGCEVIGRERHANGAVFLVATHQRQHGPFDFTIAADGARSNLRSICGLRASVLKYNHGTLWAILPGTGLPGKLLQVVRGNRFLFGLLPLGDGLVTLYWGLPLNEFDRLRDRGLDALKREIAAFSPEAADVLDLVVDFKQLILTSYQPVHMPLCYDPR